ncbi:MAG: ATP-dependent DNA helicase [Pseudomonadota bacterium]
MGPEGVLAQFLKDFEFRPSQIGMAQLIEKAIKKKMPAIIEAGTGTGKTLGYLVPVLLSGKKTVISTGTKNLQEQIFLKDIPLLSRATGLKIDAMLMKGRKNYLCLHRYHQFFSQTGFLKQDQEIVRKRIQKWLGDTEFADRSELPWMSDDNPVWDAISSASDQCLGSDCIHTEDCYLNALRRRAAQSPVIIVNHHLFFADLMVKKGGFGEIIPRFQVLVIDEAHNIEEIATSYFGERLSTQQITELVDEIEKGRKGRRDAKKQRLKKHLNLIRSGVESLRVFFDHSGEKGRLDQDTLQVIYHGPVHNIRQGLGHIKESKGILPEGIGARAGELDQCLEKIFSLNDPNVLVWYEKRKRTFVLYASPLDISQHMNEFLYKKVKTIVFTSATLSTNGNFNYIRSRLGLADPILEGIYPSHFDLERQTLMYIPKDLPPPAAPDFGRNIAKRILEILKITSGRALILFTSHHNLNLVHQLIAEKIPYTILKQGDAPRSILLDEFKRDTHSILLATSSFWQGVDVPGQALSCLIVDKLPFESPGEPLVAARIESIRTHGGNPFMEYQIPSAIITLKQGLGRLIRNRSDRGILSILDTRILTARYGRLFLDSLPKIPLSHDLSDIGRFFDQ